MLVTLDGRVRDTNLTKKKRSSPFDGREQYNFNLRIAIAIYTLSRESKTRELISPGEKMFAAPILPRTATIDA